MSTRSNRNYRNADRYLLWSRSGGLCGFPECRIVCVRPANDNDASAVIGDIAHIEGLNDQGPRANPNLSLQERNSYDNLILLCPTHHRLVDAQDSTYTVEMLRSWKESQEARFDDFLAQAMPNITFAELTTITNALVNGEQPPLSPITVIPPQDKIARNGLTEKSSRLFNIGLIQIQQVRHFVEDMGSLDHTFVGRLTTGFAGEYQRQRQAGLEGDSLFAAMFRFSAQGSTELLHQGAGLAVLVYLFESCEVFEQ